MFIVESLERTEYRNNMKCNYIYRIIKDKYAFKKYSVKEVQSYGIEAERQDIINGEIVNIERDMIKYISPHRYKVQNLLKILYDNTVSPIHLIDILGQYVDDYISDFDELLNDTYYIC